MRCRNVRGAAPPPFHGGLAQHNYVFIILMNTSPGPAVPNHNRHFARPFALELFGLFFFSLSEEALF